MQHFTDFDECVKYLTTEIFKTTLVLRKNNAAFEHSAKILDVLGNPQNSTATIHIAATSGKGSMGYAIEAILRAHGFTTTLMVSPHAYDIRERIQQNGELISKQDFIKLAEDFVNSMHKNNLDPTYFEALMSMGFLAAAKQKCDYTVAETGLGGLWDTSNTINRQDKIAVIGSIGFDHTHILGNTLEEIAFQKAGIMPKNGVAIVLHQTSEINEVFYKTAKERNAKFIWVDPEHSAYETNWLMAKTTTQFIAERDGWVYNEDLANKAIKNLKMPARFEIREINNKKVILDAAHNPQKAAALVSWLGEKYPGQKFTTILAISEGKDAGKIVETLNKVTNKYNLTAFFTDQQDMPVHAMPVKDLVKIIEEFAPNLPFKQYNNSKEALKKCLNGDQLLITGSFYLVGELGNCLQELQNM